MSAIQQTYMTADQLYAMHDDGFRYELVRGELVKMPPAGSEHGDVSGTIHVDLGWYVRNEQLGKVLSSDTGYRLADDHVLAPDVSFIANARIPESGLPVGYFPGAPDLAVEVVSPSEREVHAAQKVADYIAYGCKMVIVVHPGHRRVEVHTPARSTLNLGPGDTLDGGDAVPGWRVSVSDIFA